MPNKLPWFTHDHDAHTDLALRSAVRKHGHVAGWVWWCTLELLHKHGVGDTLRMPLVDMAASMMVDKRVCKTVYMTLYESGLITSATYEQEACTVCTVVIEKFRKRQAKLKFKTPSTLHEDSSKTPQEREEEEERENILGGGPSDPTPKPRSPACKTATEAGKKVVVGGGNGAVKGPSAAPGGPATSLPGSALTEEPQKRKGVKLEDRKDPSSRLLSRHCINFKNTYGHECSVNFSRDMKLAGELLEILPLDVLQRASDSFFQDKEPFVRQAGHPFSLFKFNVNKYTSRCPAPKSQASDTRPVVPRAGEITPWERVGNEMVRKEWDGKKWLEFRQPVKEPVKPSPSRKAVSEEDVDDPR